MISIRMILVMRNKGADRCAMNETLKQSGYPRIG